MSTIKAANIQNPSAASAAIVLDTSGNFSVPAGTVSAPGIQAPSDSNTGIFFPAADTIAFAEGGSEAMRIDSSSRLLVGTSSGALNNARAVFRGNPLGASETVLELSRGTTVTAVSDGLGSIIFTDSSSNRGAAIIAESEGSWTSGSNHRSRLVFSTTADGASSPTERWRITSDGTFQSGSSVIKTNFLTRAMDNQRVLVNQNETYYVSDSGSDSTGDGSTGNPYRTLNKAFEKIPKLYTDTAISIKIKGPSYTASSYTSFSGYGGAAHTSYYSGAGITIEGDGGAITYNMNNYGIDFEAIGVPLRFKNINFVGHPSPGGAYNGMAFMKCSQVYVYNTCSWTTSNQGSWSWTGGVRFYEVASAQWDAPVTVTSAATAGYGGLFVFDNCRQVSWSGNITKSGTRYGQAALVAINNTFMGHSGVINNFDNGIRLGFNHYSAEDGAQCVLGSTQLLNCNVGVGLHYMSSLRAYYVTNTSGTTTVYSVNSGSHQH